MFVFVVDVVDDDVLELGSVPDEGAIEKLAAQGADSPFGEGIRDWGPHRVFKSLMASVRKVSSNAAVDSLPRSRTSALQAASAWQWCKNRLRAAWVVQSPVGWAVIPA